MAAFLERSRGRGFLDDENPAGSIRRGLVA
jgi:hypothetical protein